MECRCSIEVVFPDAKKLDAAIEALSHEGGLSERSASKMETQGRTLVLSVEAKDMVALRATVNAFLRAVQAFEGIEKRE